MKTYTKPIDTAPKDGTLIAVQDQKELLHRDNGTNGKRSASRRMKFWPTSLAYYNRGKWVFANPSMGYNPHLKWRLV